MTIESKNRQLEATGKNADRLSEVDGGEGSITGKFSWSSSSITEFVIKIEKLVRGICKK